jgi:hypothetical protein
MDGYTSLLEGKQKPSTMISKEKRKRERKKDVYGSTEALLILRFMIR